MSLFYLSGLPVVYKILLGGTYFVLDLLVLNRFRNEHALAALA